MVLRAIGQAFSLSEGEDGFSQNEAAYRQVTSFDWLQGLKRKNTEDRRWGEESSQKHVKFKFGCMKCFATGVSK